MPLQEPFWHPSGPKMPPGSPLRTTFGIILAHFGSHSEGLLVAPGVVWGHSREQTFCMKLCSPVAQESPARPFPPAPPGLGILLEGRTVGDTSADSPASNPSSTAPLLTQTSPAFPPQRAPRGGGSATWISARCPCGTQARVRAPYSTSLECIPFSTSLECIPFCTSLPALTFLQYITCTSLSALHFLHSLFCTSLSALTSALHFSALSCTYFSALYLSALHFWTSL